MRIETKGTTAIKPVYKEPGCEVAVSNVHYIPQLSVNLLSVSKIVSKQGICGWVISAQQGWKTSKQISDVILNTNHVSDCSVCAEGKCCRRTYCQRTISKHEVLRTFQGFHVIADRQTYFKIKTIQTDNGVEYTNKKFQSYLEKFGIQHQRTNDFSRMAWQNDMADSGNQTIVERASCMLSEDNFNKSFCAEVVSTVVDRINSSPTHGNSMTPEEY